jgi:hypothetical protein
MPCPPSWEEQEISRADDSVAASTAELQKTWPQLLTTLPVARRLRELRPTITEPDLDRSFEEAGALLSLGGKPPPYPGPMPETKDGWPTHTDIEMRQAEAKYYADLARNTELCLCVLRTWMCLVRRDAPLSDDDPLASSLQTERALHLAHRLAERQHALRTAQEHLAIYLRLEDGELSARLQEQIKRLSALGDEDLLCDRRSTQV